MGHGVCGTDTVLDRHVAIKAANLAIAARSESAARFNARQRRSPVLNTPTSFTSMIRPQETGAPAFGDELIEKIPWARGWTAPPAQMPEVACLVAAQVADAQQVAHDGALSTATLNLRMSLSNENGWRAPSSRISVWRVWPTRP